MRVRTGARLTRVVAAFALVVLVGSAVVLLACRPGTRSSPPLTRVKVASANFPASAPIYVASEKGFFRDEGLDASIDNHAIGRLALDAALEGKADFATVADTPIARAVLDGESPMVVAEIAEVDSANVIIARKDRGIAMGEDLKGKRVGVLAGTIADFFLHIYLVTSGVDPATVTRVPLTADQLVPAVTSGRVDAISAFAPFNFDAEDKLGGNALVLDEPGVYTITWNVAVRADFSHKKQDTIARFLRAVVRANDFIASHPEEAQAITSKNTGISARRLRKLWSTNQWTLKLDQTLVLTLEDESRWMLGDKGSAPDFLKYIDTKPLASVRPAGVGIVQPKD